MCAEFAAWSGPGLGCCIVAVHGWSSLATSAAVQTGFGSDLLSLQWFPACSACGYGEHGHMASQDMRNWKNWNWI